MILMQRKQTKTSKTTLGKFIRALFSKETPTYIKAFVGVAVAYTVFPIDVIPDILGIVGYADDAAVLGLLTTVAMTLLDNHNTKVATEPVRNFEEVNE